jgi:hypothetical protein
VGTVVVRVTASNAIGSDSRLSGPVVIEPALAAPSITGVAVLPSAGRVGDSFAASVLAAGNPAPDLSYQWLLNGATIPGATGPNHVATAPGALAVRATATNPLGSVSLYSAAASVSAVIGAPVASGALLPQVFTEATGLQSYDVSRDFSVAGDAALSSVTWTLLGGDAVFTAGVFENGVLTAAADGYVSIGASGIVTIDTDRSGPLTPRAVVVRAINAAGAAESAFGLTVEGATGGTNPEKLVNGDFSGGSTGWFTNSSVTITGGAAIFEGVGTLRQPGVPLEAGSRYEVVIDVDRVSSGRLRAQFVGQIGVNGGWITAAGIYSEELTAQAGNSEFRLTSASGSSAAVSKISLRKVS